MTIIKVQHAQLTSPIVFTLYGECDNARYEKEHKIAQQRAEAMAWIRPKEKIWRNDEWLGARFSSY